MIRSHRLLVAFALAACTSATVLACEAETGPGPPERTNGCIDLECKVTPTPMPISDSGPPDAA